MQHLVTYKLFESALNKSTDPKVFYSKLQDQFADLHHKYDEGPTGEFLESIELRLKHPYTNELDSFLRKHNWYISRLNNQNKMELRPIYSTAIVSMPQELYHASPSTNDEEILSVGLLPKSNDLRHKYPPRIYLAGSLRTIKTLIPEMKRYSRIKKRYSGMNDYTIFQIDTRGMNTTLYKDDTCSFSDCYYIQDYPIPANNIHIVR